MDIRTGMCGIMWNVQTRKLNILLNSYSPNKKADDKHPLFDTVTFVQGAYFVKSIALRSQRATFQKVITIH